MSTSLTHHTLTRAIVTTLAVMTGLYLAGVVLAAPVGVVAGAVFSPAGGWTTITVAVIVATAAKLR